MNDQTVKGKLLQIIKNRGECWFFCSGCPFALSPFITHKNYVVAVCILREIMSDDLKEEIDTGDYTLIRGMYNDYRYKLALSIAIAYYGKGVIVEHLI